MYGTTVFKTSNAQIQAIVTPNPASLSLGIAKDAAAKARSLLKKLVFRDVVAPERPARDVAVESLPALYDYLQFRMIVVVSCFQAIEAFCNELIARKLRRTYNLKRKKGHIEANSDKLQRLASTEEKLTQILPLLLQIKTPQGTDLWVFFEELKSIRDATVHMKTRRADPLHLDTQILYSKLFNDNIEEFPHLTVQLLSHFLTAQETPRWLSMAGEILNPGPPSGPKQ